MWLKILQLTDVTIILIMSDQKKCNENCCVVGCLKTYKNTAGLRLFCFPNRPWEIERRKAWIRAVNRKNPDGTDWQPTRNSRICSSHFEGGQPVNHPDSPAFIPTIFPSHYKQEGPNFKAQKRKQDRKVKAEITDAYCIVENVEETTERKKMVDASSQTDLTICCTKIVESIVLRDTDQDVDCRNTKTSATSISTVCDSHGFQGRVSISENQEMLDVAGVTMQGFHQLLDLLPLNLKGQKISLEDRLLMFLIKMKHNFTDSAIAVLFGIHRSTSEVMCKEILQTFKTTNVKDIISVVEIKKE